MRTGEAKIEDWSSSHYVFENGDGSKYTVHLMHHCYGGTLVAVNDSSLWLAFENVILRRPAVEVKFLCGNNNEYTKRAVEQIMLIHWERVQAALIAKELIE